MLDVNILKCPSISCLISNRYHANIMFGVYLSHSRTLVGDNYQLNKALFCINEPFYMKSEKESIQREILGLKRKRKLKRNFYEEKLNEKQKLIISKIINQVKLNDNTLSGDNEDAKRAANVHINQAIDIQTNTSFCNDNDHLLLIDGYLIPPKCSFMCSDVIHGLQLMHKYYSEGRFQIDKDFLIIIDPPWLNKSVKRKKCYFIQNHQDILKTTQELSLFINCLPIDVLVKIAIWTTECEKSFVIDEMIPTLNSTVTHVMLWHKITKTGQSVKLRGGCEYLIIASLIVKSLTVKSLNYQKLSSDDECMMKNGVLVSIPSAIHSHKPPITFEFIQRIQSLNPNESEIIIMMENEGQVNTDNKQFAQTEIGLIKDRINNRINGLELYARYLRHSFHSIGFECIQLQHELFYESNNN